jgi:hypothetical protein
VSLTGNTVVGPTCVKWYQSEVRHHDFSLVKSPSIIFMVDPNLLIVLERMQQNHTETIQVLTTLVERLAPTNNQNNLQNPQNNNNPPFNQNPQPPNCDRWDNGIRIEIPEEYLDWTSKVEEVFELKEVPLDKQVSLVTIKLRDRAAAWWQSFKYRCYLDDLPPLNLWLDLKHEMNREFLPLNYRQTLFQQEVWRNTLLNSINLKHEINSMRLKI